MFKLINERDARSSVDDRLRQRVSDIDHAVRDLSDRLASGEADPHQAPTVAAVRDRLQRSFEVIAGVVDVSDSACALSVAAVVLGRAAADLLAVDVPLVTHRKGRRDVH